MKLFYWIFINAFDFLFKTDFNEYDSLFQYALFQPTQHVINLLKIDFFNIHFIFQVLNNLNFL